MLPNRTIQLMNTKSLLIILLLSLAALSGCSVPASHVVYVPLPSLNEVDVFQIKNGNGALTEVIGAPFPAGNGPDAICVPPGSKFAYTTNQKDNDISLLKIDPKSGGVTEILPRTPARFNPVALITDSAGKFLFVANEGASNISVYAIDPSSGKLTEVQGSPFPTPLNPTGLVLSSSDKFLYVANAGIDAVSAYSVDTGTGAIQPLAGSPFLVGRQPSALAVTPSSNFLFVANTTDNTISALTINSDGSLSNISGSPFVAGTNPLSMVVHPNGDFLYVGNRGGNISSFSIGSDGVLTSITQSVTFSNGVSIAMDPTEKFVVGASQNSLQAFSITNNASTTSLSTNGGLNTTSNSTLLVSTPGRIFITP